MDKKKKASSVLVYALLIDYTSFAHKIKGRDPALPYCC